MSVTLLIAALALTPATAPAPAITAPVTAQASDLDRLVLLMVPDQRILDLSLAAARQEAMKQPEFARDPAMLDYVLKRMWPEISKTLREKLPELRTEIAKILSTTLTPAEISDLYVFFSNPTGQKLQQAIFDVIAEHPNAGPEEQQRLFVDKFMATLAPGDYAPLSQVGASSAAQKMPDLNPRIAAASDDWVTRVLGRESARMEVLRTQAIAEYRRQKAGQ